eukprot:SAG11_NODE_145_length_14811_cov_24.558931_2_plen_135_part_00
MNSNSPEILISDNQMQPTNTPKRKGISIYDFGKDRMVYFKNPYGANGSAAATSIPVLNLVSKIWVKKKSVFFFNCAIYIMPSRQEILKMKARYAANPLYYKKVIVERSFAKDWKPKFPLYPIPRMRNVVAFANR